MVNRYDLIKGCIEEALDGEFVLSDDYDELLDQLNASLVSDSTMKTIFIDGGEYVDKKTYIQLRKENDTLRGRCLDAEARIEELTEWIRAECVHNDFCDVYEFNDSGQHLKCSCGLEDLLKE